MYVKQKNQKHFCDIYNYSALEPPLQETINSLPDWKQIKTALKRRRHSCPLKELARLKQDERIARAFTSVGPFPSRAHQIAYGHSLELQREASKVGYLAFNHGQNLPLMVVNMFAKELLRRAYPQRDLGQYHVLRHPCFHRDGNNPSLEEIRESLAGGHFTDRVLRDQLLSVDLYLRNSSPEESALSFFRDTCNKALQAAGSSSLVRALCKRIALNYTRKESVVNRVVDGLAALADELGSGGNLYTICLPESSLSRVAYRSHRLGQPCHHQHWRRLFGFFPYRKIGEREIASGLQQSLNSSCPYSCDGISPQYRLYTAALRREEGVRIFLHSTLDREEKNRVKERIRQLAAQCFAGSTPQTLCQ